MGDIVVTAAQVGAVYPELAEIVPKIAAVAITAGQVLYQDTAGKMNLADEDASAAASQVVGVALDSVGVGQATRVLRRGHVYGFTVSSLNCAVAVSLSNTAGALLDTGATTNIVGWIEALPDGNATKVLFVNVGFNAAAS